MQVVVACHTLDIPYVIESFKFDHVKKPRFISINRNPRWRGMHRYAPSMRSSLDVVDARSMMAANMMNSYCVLVILRKGQDAWLA